MYFYDVLFDLMELLYDNLVTPIQSFIINFGVTTDLALFDIKIGFGEITWFSINLNDLLVLVIGFTVSITALVLTWKFIRFLNGFLKGLFTGIKR